MPTNAPVRKPGKTARQALIVLGMHRTGTSALSGVLAKLGAQAPKSLMPPTPDNPRGYWESTAIMKFHDRILESAGTRWSDWDSFNPEWVDSPAGAEILADISSLLQDEYGDARLILIKDPRMCRLFPLWATALEALDITPKVVIPLRRPAEVAKSLEVRDHLARNQAKLLWLRHLLDAEYSTRSTVRAFVRYTDLLDDWQTQVDRLSHRLDVKWPRQSSAAEAEIDDYLSPELRHHATIDHTLPVNSAIARWVADAYRAIDSLIDDPRRVESLQLLDSIRQEFNETSGIFAPVVHEQRYQFERRIEVLDEEIRKLAAELTDLDSRHVSLQQENVSNYQLYDTDHKALAELRKHFQEREDAFVAMTSRYEVMQAEMASQTEEARSAHASQAGLASKVEVLEAAYAKLESDHQHELAGAANRLNLEVTRLKDTARLAEESLKQRFADTITQLNLEIRQLKDAARLAEESLEERFAETAQLTKAVFELEDNLTAERTTTQAERDHWNARLDDAGRIVSERDKNIRTLRATVDENNSRIRTLELEIDAQSKLIVEYHTTLETIRSGRYQRLATTVRRMTHPSRKIRSKDDDRPDEEVLRRSHLFDRDWYLERYPDVRSKGIDPVRHYLKYGAKEGRDPSAAFSTAGYVSRYPDVTAAGANPLVHYLKYGRREGRLISVPALEG